MYDFIFFRYFCVVIFNVYIMQTIRVNSYQKHVVELMANVDENQQMEISNLLANYFAQKAFDAADVLESANAKTVSSESVKEEAWSNYQLSPEISGMSLKNRKLVSDNIENALYESLEEKYKCPTLYTHL